MTVTFELDGEQFIALNGGPEFEFTQAVSFVVNCETQEEVDYFWKKLSAGGKEVQCGWLEDKFGLSWQIVPTFVTEVLLEGDPERTGAMMAKVLEMKKLDLDVLERAVRSKVAGY